MNVSSVRRLLACLASVVGVSAVPLVLAAPTPRFDLQRDFSTNSNPNEAWTYGYTSDPAIGVTPLDKAGSWTTDDGVTFEYWRHEDGFPSVLHNGTTDIGSYEEGVPLGPGELVGFSAAFPERLYFVARLTVPVGAGGLYHLEAVAARLFPDDISWQTNFNVRLNHSAVFDAPVPGPEQVALTNDVFVAAGDLMDFLVLVGEDAASAKLSARATFLQSGRPIPAIARQPEDVINRLGSNAIFRVSANPVPALYQWQHNGLPLEGETNRVLQITNVQLNQAGAYRVIVSNASGSVTSAVGRLILDRRPVVVSQPLPERLPAGWTATFAVVVEGEGPLGFQWFRNGAVVSGQHTNVFHRQNLAPNDAGNYTVVVSNAFGAVTSSPVVLMVTDGPAFDLQRDFSTNSNPNYSWSYGYYPWDGSGRFVLAEMTAEIASENGTPLEAWLYPNGGTLVLHNGTSTTATLGSSMSFPPDTVAMFPSPLCDIEVAAVRLALPPGGPGTYRLDAFAQSAFAGPEAGPAQFHILINGTEFATVPVSGPGQAGWTNLFSLNDGDVIELEAGENGCEAAPNNELKLSLSLQIWTNGITAPSITAPPESVTVREGSPVSLSVTAAGTPILRYAWFRNGSPVAAAEGPGLDLAAVFPGTAGQYRVVVSNNAGAVTSAVAAITIDYTPRILDGPYDAAVRYGEDASFSILADGGEPLSYQWSRDGAPIPGATNSLLVLSNVTGAAQGSYTVLVSSAHGTALSAAARLDVLLDPYIITQPQTITALAGFPVTLHVIAGGQPPLAYQWRLDGFPLPNATNPTLLISNVNETTSGSYDVLVSSLVGTVESSPARVFVRRDAVFDVRRDFSLGANPNNVWTYGWSFGWPAAEILLDDEPGVTTAGGGSPLEFWRATFAGIGLPAVFHNPSANPVANGGLSTYEPGGVAVIATQNANFRPAIIRCTVPNGADGRYRMEVFTQSHSDRMWFDVVTFRVMVGTNEVFAQQLSDADDVAAYTNQVDLRAGDTVDFGVTREEWVTPGGTGVQLAAILALETPQMAPPAPFLRPVFSGGQIHINVETVTARTYRLLRSTNLVDWTIVRTDVSTGRPLQYDMLVTGADRTFYRIRSP